MDSEFQISVFSSLSGAKVWHLKTLEWVLTFGDLLWSSSVFPNQPRRRVALSAYPHTVCQCRISLLRHTCQACWLQNTFSHMPEAVVVLLSYSFSTPVGRREIDELVYCRASKLAKLIYVYIHSLLFKLKQGALVGCLIHMSQYCPIIWSVDLFQRNTVRSWFIIVWFITHHIGHTVAFIFLHLVKCGCVLIRFVPPTSLFFPAVRMCFSVVPHCQVEVRRRTKWVNSDTRQVKQKKAELSLVLKGIF